MITHVPSSLNPNTIYNSSLSLSLSLIMSRVSMNTLLSLSRRSYSVEATRLPAAASAAVRRSAAAAAEEEKEIFWMRDPKTGNWIPENRFQEMDAAELRDQLLPNISIIKLKK